MSSMSLRKQQYILLVGEVRTRRREADSTIGHPLSLIDNGVQQVLADGVFHWSKWNPNTG